MCCHPHSSYNKYNPIMLTTLLPPPTRVLEVIREKMLEKETLAFHSFVSPPFSYIRVQGYLFHDDTLLSHLNELIQEKTEQALASINTVNVLRKEAPPPLEQTHSETELFIEQIIDKFDTHIFDKNHRHWEDPQTLAAKTYLQQKSEEERKWKEAFKKKRDAILNRQNELRHLEEEEIRKKEKQRKEQLQKRVANKLDTLKKDNESRQQFLQRSLQVIKERGKPLYQKIKQQYDNVVESALAQEQRRKLQKIKDMHRSIDMQQIAEHRERCQRALSQREKVIIFDNPLKVSFKSHFHSTLTPQAQETELYRRSHEYAQTVRTQHAPAVSPRLAAEMQERIKILKRKRVRVNKPLRYLQEGDEDEEEKEPSKPPTPQEPQEAENSEEEDEEPIKKDDQTDPTRAQRYKQGINYLQQAKKLRKNTPTNTIQNTQQQQKTSTKVIYKDYLKEIARHKTIDWLDSSRIQSQLKKQETDKTRIELEISKAEEKAKREEELIKFKKPDGSTIQKKLELDSVVVEAIKARLTLMNR